jgi:2-methylcitrate dehydratase PrpD
MTLARQIADRIHQLRFEDITPTALEWTRHAFIDTVGCMLAGMSEDGPRILQQIPGIAEAPGPALIHASNRRTSVLDATLVNGTASHALDYDDVAGVLGGHPSAMLVPPLIALGEAVETTGIDLVVAYVAGFETMCRIARGVHFHHYDKGWHPTATLGIFGTVAAASRLLRLSPDTTAVALGMAASFASGLKANFGTMTKPLHVGHTTRNGLFAALMAQRGFTANPAALEHRQGFLDVFNGPGSYDAARILADWYAPIEAAGAADPGLKPYPCCGSTHASVSRTIALATTHDLSPERIERIEVMPHPRRLPHTNNPDPRTPLAAKFSIQYCVARALANRAVRLEHFEGEAHFDPTIRALLPRIAARAHPDMSTDSPHQWGTEVVVHTRDGERFASRLDDYPSRGPAGIPMTRDELWTKFSDCGERSLPRTQLPPLFDKLASIETISCVGELTALLETPAANATSRAA